MNLSPASLERAALLHAALVLSLASWAFGGNIAWARSGLCVAGTAGLLLSLLAVRQRRREEASLRALHWLWPVLAFDLLVIISAFTPSFREIVVEGSSVFAPQSTASWGPSAARPEVALRTLWLWNALYFPCFNLALIVRQRRSLRGLLYFAVIQAAVLSVFGTLQKLLQASGLYFGAVHSPNPNFFGSFIYQNHWGAYAVLALGIGLSLLFHVASRRNERGFWNSPAFGLAAAVVLIALTIPFSGSRACTALALGLLGLAIGHGTLRWIQARRFAGQSAALPLAAAAAVSGAVFLAAVWVGRPVIEARLRDTREQLSAMRQQGGIGSRAQLYSDTWKMAAAKPVFGWGLGSYATVFPLYNSQESAIDRLPVYYADAHSDWLQALAEVGAVGTLLLLAGLLLPLWEARRKGRLGAPAGYLLAACAAVLAYAWVEFPFGCPAVMFLFLLSFFVAVRLCLLEEPVAPSPPLA